MQQALGRGGQRRVLAVLQVAEPLLPRGGVKGPLGLFDAPCGRVGGQVEGFALGKREAARDSGLGGRHQCLRIGKDLPDARRVVVGGSDDALAVRAERRAVDRAFVAFERLPPRRAGPGGPHPPPPRCGRADAVTMRLLSGLNAALLTAPSWPSSGSPIGWPVAASQTRAVLSEDAVTMRLPSGLNAALLTAPSWPLSGSPLRGAGAAA